MSRLLENSKQYRDVLTSKNTYDQTNNYSSSHPNALSDGDDKGRGEVNGVIGTITDITKRSELCSKNLYSKDKPYDDTRA